MPLRALPAGRKFGSRTRAIGAGGPAEGSLFIQNGANQPKRQLQVRHRRAGRVRGLRSGRKPAPGIGIGESLARNWSPILPATRTSSRVLKNAGRLPKDPVVRQGSFSAGATMVRDGRRQRPVKHDSSLQGLSAVSGEPSGGRGAGINRGALPSSLRHRAGTASLTPPAGPGSSLSSSGTGAR